MSYLKNQMSRLKYDVRLKNNNIRRGLVAESDWQSHLKQLPDLKESTTKLDFEDKKSQES